MHYDAAEGIVYDLQGLTLTDGGSDYAWSLIKVTADDLTVTQDVQLGESSVEPMNGPVDLKLYRDKYFFTGGAIM